MLEQLLNIYALTNSFSHFTVSHMCAWN